MTNSPIKVLFLDIDGVLATWWSYKNQRPGSRNGRRRIPFYQDCVKNLNRIIEETGCKIVMSSTWRVGQLLEHLQALLKSEGVVGELIGDTPILSFDPYARRGKEILTWLNTNQELNIQSIVILDDEVSSIRDVFPGRFVHTSMVGGLQEMHVQEAVQILNRELSAKELKQIREVDDQGGSLQTEASDAPETLAQGG